MGIKLTEAFNKLNDAISAKLESNKDEIIQSLTNEVSSLQSRVGKFESQVCLLEDALINNEIKINNADQYNRRNNIEIPPSVKSKDLEYKVKMNVKVTKNDIEARHRLSDREKQ